VADGWRNWPLERPTRGVLTSETSSQGDGVKFKGAGYLQLTGRYNYSLFAKAVDDPKVLELGCPYVAKTYPITSAAWWWKEVGKLVPLCDTGSTVKEVTLVVNGGANGLREREALYRKTLDVI